MWQAILSLLVATLSAQVHKLVAPTSLLIQGGHVLTFAPGSTPSDPQISFHVTDILIEGDTITRIAPNLNLPLLSILTRVIDARGHIVSPGFVDAHRHMFQVAERAIVFPKPVADQTIHEYLGYVELAQSRLWNPEDVYWGQLMAASAAISGGITTIFDHCHVSYNNESVESAVRASIASGLRSVFAPQKMDQTTWEDWQAAQLLSLGERLPAGGHGRVTLGFAYDSIYVDSPTTANATMEIVRAAGVNLTTFHYAPAVNYGSILAAHANYPLDASFSAFVVSHATRALPEEFELLQRVGAGMVSTPGTDAPMAMGDAEAFGRMQKGQTRIGFGVDINPGSPANMFSTMRMGLQGARIMRNEDIYAGRTGVRKQSLPKRLTQTIAHAARFATLGGAEALHMESSIGSIEEGKKGDVIIITLDSPGMLGIDPAEDRSLLAGLVMYANPSDVRTVVIGGEVVKDSGELTRVKWYGKGGLVHSFGQQRDDLVRRLRASSTNWTAQYEAVMAQLELTQKLV